MENFIAAYHSAYTKEYCNQVIDWFEQMTASGFSQNRQELENAPKLIKDDTVVFPTAANVLKFSSSGTLFTEFLDLFFKKYYLDYMSKFSVLEAFDSQTVYDLKIQKTLPGGGYHVWHCEVSNRNNASRLLVFTLYLNDIEEGGETEYLYQGLRIKPEQGTLVLWPAGFTHVHRGNPPLKETKYIVTGWVEFR